MRKRGRPIKLTDSILQEVNYLRNMGATWSEIEEKIGMHASTIQRRYYKVFGSSAPTEPMAGKITIALHESAMRYVKANGRCKYIRELIYQDMATKNHGAAV